MNRRTSNQSYFVLGHKTANIRDLYTLGCKLGQGQFGTTYLCTEISTGNEYACKSISKRKLISKEDVEDVRREIQIMHHLAGHKNVVTIKGAYEDPLYVHIVMELCGGGELFDRIIQRGHYSERKAAKHIKIIVGVVEACHSLGVMIRDLKPENFLLLNKDNDFSIKAIDFGLSVFFRPGQIFTDVVGSPYYVAPEVLLKHYGPKADVWTAGVILYILLSGVPPFWAETQQGIFDAVLKGQIDFDSNPWPLISESAKDLIRKMLCMRPSERLTAHKVLCHPWICENGVAPNRALDPAVLSRLNQFSAMNKLKKMALRVIAESLSEEEIAGLREMFKAMDTDNSGAITFDELKAGLRKYGSTLKDTEIRDLMDAADVDNSGTMDYGEFIAATIHLNKLEREEHLWAAFQYFDKDGSGYITVDELQQVCEEHGMTDVFLHDVIEEVDQDNDGMIDYGEFVALMTKDVKYAPSRSKVRSKKVDQDNDGRIHYARFVDLTKKDIKSTPSKSNISSKEVDQDNDGRTNCGGFVDMTTKDVESTPSKMNVSSEEVNEDNVKPGFDRNERRVGDLFMKVVIVCLLIGLVFWCLGMKHLWSATFVITMFVGKMINSFVSDKIDDWIVKSVLAVTLHFLSVLFGRWWKNKSTT